VFLHLRLFILLEAGMIDVFSLMLFEPIIKCIPPTFVKKLDHELKLIGGSSARLYLSRGFLFFTILLFGSIIGIVWSPGFLLFPVGFVFLFLSFMYPKYVAAQLVEKIIEKLPASLMSAASSIQAGQTPEEAFDVLSRKEFGGLSRIFSQTVRISVVQKMDLGKSLSLVVSRYNNKILNRVAALVSIGIGSGTNLHQLFNTCARDVLSIRELRREQINQMQTLKWALILSGVILIPAILAYSVKISDFLYQTESTLEFSSKFSFIPLSIVLAFIVASFCDVQISNSVVYFPFFLVIQFIVFSLI